MMKWLTIMENIHPVIPKTSHQRLWNCPLNGSVRSMPNSTPNRYSSDKAKERRDEEVVVAVHGISKTLNQLVKRVESTETEVKKVKGRLKGVSNSSSIGETPTQVSVPLFVRVSEGIRLLKLKLV